MLFHNSFFVADLCYNVRNLNYLKYTIHTEENHDVTIMSNYVSLLESQWIRKWWTERFLLVPLSLHFIALHHTYWLKFMLCFQLFSFYLLFYLFLWRYPQSIHLHMHKKANLTTCLKLFQIFRICVICVIENVMTKTFHYYWKTNITILIFNIYNCADISKNQHSFT